MTIAAAALMAALAATLLWAARPVEAAFPGPNGNIAFTSSRDSNNFEIYSMAPTPSSSQTNLTNMNPATNSGAQDFQASFSPDGTRIAFATSRNGNNEIYVMDADGSDPTRLTNNPADDGAPAFSPDGKIAFHSSRDGGNFDIYVMDAADGDNDSNGDDLKRLTRNIASDTEPSFSPGGGKIAFTSARAGNDEVYVMKPLPEGRKNRPRNLTKNAASDRHPAFSPNGKQIAFASNRDGNSEIYRMNADGTRQTRLTANTAQDLEPDWGVLAP
jgi:Tol biopolymer transport system component